MTAARPMLRLCTALALLFQLASVPAQAGGTAAKPAIAPAHSEPAPEPWRLARVADAWREAGHGALAEAFAAPSAGAATVPPEAFAPWFEQAVGRLHVGPHAATTALYAAWARETSPEDLPDGRLGLRSMPGMNIATAQALAMFGGPSTCPADGAPTPVLEVALEPGEPLLRIDPTQGPHVPGLVVLAPLAPPAPLPVARVLGLHALACAAHRDGRALLLFATAPEPALLRHELAHALFAAHPGWREAVLARARSLTPRERDLAMLLAAGLYDALDPEVPRRHPWLVIDEIANAWHDEDPRLLDGGRAPASAADLLARLGVRLALHAEWPAGDLALPDEDRARVMAWRAAHPGAPAEQALREVHALGWLWDRLAAEHPATIARLREARAALLDEPLAAAARIDDTPPRTDPPSTHAAGAHDGDPLHAPRGRGLERGIGRSRRRAARGRDTARGHS